MLIIVMIIVMVIVMVIVVMIDCRGFDVGFRGGCHGDGGGRRSDGGHGYFGRSQGWEFAHSLITHSLICSFRSNQMSDRERMAQVPHDK